MKLSLNQEIRTDVSTLWKLLSDTSVRKSWIPFFEGEETGLLKENLTLNTVYSFVNQQKCREHYFRIIPNKEIAFNIETAKGVWTVFIILKEIEDGVDMMVSAELKSATWWPSLMSWMEVGKLEINVREILQGFKGFTENSIKSSVSSIDVR